MTRCDLNKILLSPYILSSELTMPNKIVMAPMTRRKATSDHVPTDAMINYYARRANAGLIITEGTLIHSDAVGYGNVPGIYTQEQISQWKKITDAVHQKNGRIFVQLWHCGRISHPDFHQGRLPISASNTKANIPLGSTGLQCSQAKAATLSEIKHLIFLFTEAAINALDAGFDGIELHGANGYLIDQFLHYSTNQREDQYGQTPENMANFLLEIIQSIGLAIGLNKIGVRLSPAGYMNEIVTDPKDQFVFSYLLSQLNHYPIAYVHTGTFNDATTYIELNGKTMSDFLRTHYHGTLIASGSYPLNKAALSIQQNKFDLIAIGRLFIANPDLITLLQNPSLLLSYDETLLQKELY